jgi:phosphoglycerate dehydrogenase-like enzyme
VARNVGTVAGFPVVDEAALPALLAETDLLICLLPATAANRHIIDDAVFARLPSGARFVNVGRGATLDESALIAALTSGRLRNAAIDVAEVEPLPADSPLWDTPNLLITPHIAGNRPQGVATFLTEQIRAWKAGGAAALRNVVAR